MFPTPPTNTLILAGRIDAASFQQAISCCRYLNENKQLPIQITALLPTDWESFKQELYEKASILGLDNKCKGIVSEVIYDSDFNIFGPGTLLLDIAKNTYEFSDSTPLKMYQSAARTRYKKHLALLCEQEGVSFVKFVLGQASTQFSNDLEEIGTFTLMLFERDCPQTVSRFISLVNKGIYTNCLFTMINEAYIQTNNIPVDIVPIPDECFEHHHDVMGMVGFSRNIGESHSNGNTSSLYITLESLPEFDEGVTKKQAFGRVIDGMRFLKMLSHTERNENCQPMTQCGIMKVERFEV